MAGGLMAVKPHRGEVEFALYAPLLEFRSCSVVGIFVTAMVLLDDMGCVVGFGGRYSTLAVPFCVEAVLAFEGDVQACEVFDLGMVVASFMFSPPPGGLAHVLELVAVDNFAMPLPQSIESSMVCGGVEESALEGPTFRGDGSIIGEQRNNMEEGWWRLAWSSARPSSSTGTTASAARGVRGRDFRAGEVWPDTSSQRLVLSRFSVLMPVLEACIFVGVEDKSAMRFDLMV